MLTPMETVYFFHCTLLKNAFYVTNGQEVVPSCDVLVVMTELQKNADPASKLQISPVMLMAV